jgi:hypothetical protein
MKKSLLYILVAGVLLTSCDKNDGPVPEDVNLERGIPQPQIVKNGGDANINALNPGPFQGKFDLTGVYFSQDAPSKMDVVIRKNGNNTNVKVIAAGVTTYPASYTITSAQIATLFGAAVAVNDNYDISADVYTKDGKKYEAFPNIGIPTAVGNASGVAGQAGASPTIRYSVICQYFSTLFGAIGSTSAFEVKTDEWGDDPVNGWGPPAGYRPEVMVTVDDATHLSFKSPVDGTSKIVLTINPTTNAITFTGQPYGDLKVGPLQVDPSYPYGPATLSNLGTNNVAPCDKQINLQITYNVAAGVFRWDASRGYTLVLKQK